MDWKPPSIGAPCWIEIPATGSVIELKKFYQNVFPTWQFREEGNVEGNESEHTVDHVTFGSDKNQTGGIVKQSREHRQQDQPGGSGMTVYYLVEDLKETKDCVEKSGGRTISGIENDSNSGTHMIFRDPQGNRFGAYELTKT